MILNRVRSSAAVMCFALIAASCPRNVAHAQVPSDLPNSNDIPLAGKNGYTSPRCVHCPDPSYTDKAFRAKIQGSLTLSIVVGVDGRAHNVIVTKSLDKELDQAAVDMARNKWRFKPANGPDGKPAAVRMPVEVFFHLY